MHPPRTLLALILVAVQLSALPRTRAEVLQPVEAFPLSDVRLRAGLHQQVQQRSANWVLAIDPQRVLHLFRANAGLASDVEPRGGWECRWSSHF